MKKIKFIKKKISGRDSSGKVVVRHQGGEEKRFFRVIDFKREKKGTAGRGGQLARGAGTGATIAAHEDGLVHIKLPSGEVRKISAQSFATIGNIGNVDWKNTFFGKAGRKRHMGIR